MRFFVQMNAIVNALSAENEHEASADEAETPRLQENLRKLVIKQIKLIIKQIKLIMKQIKLVIKQILLFGFCCN